MSASYAAERAAVTTGVSSSTIVPATNCTAGNTLVLIWFNHAVAVVSSVTDTKGNTWTVDKTVVTGSGSLSICSTRQDAGALATTDTITVDLGAQTHTAVLQEFAGQYVADKNASATGTSGVGNTGTTSTTAAADEFAIAAIGAIKAGGAAVWVWTKDANYTNFTTPPPLFAGSQTRSWAAHYRILTAIGTQICTDTANQTSSTWGGAIVTYAAAVAPASARPKQVVVSQAIQRSVTRCQRLTKRRSGLFVPAKWNERIVVAA